MRNDDIFVQWEAVRFNPRIHGRVVMPEIDGFREPEPEGADRKRNGQDKEAPLPGPDVLEPSINKQLVEKLLERLPHQNEINHEVIKLIVANIEMPQKAFYGFVDDEIRYRQDRKHEISRNALWSRVGTKRLAYLDGGAFIEWGGLLLFTEKELVTFVCQVNFERAMAYLRKRLEAKGATCYAKACKAMHQTLRSDFWKLISL